MPFEMRRIVFRVPEVAQAITEYHRRMHMPLPAGTILRCAAESAGPDSELCVRLVIARDDAVACNRDGSHQEIVVDRAALAAALILYCRNRSIPLPATGEKSLRKFGDQVGLVITSGLRGASWHG